MVGAGLVPSTAGVASMMHDSTVVVPAGFPRCGAAVRRARTHRGYLSPGRCRTMRGGPARTSHRAARGPHRTSHVILRHRHRQGRAPLGTRPPVDLSE